MTTHRVIPHSMPMKTQAERQVSVSWNANAISNISRAHNLENLIAGSPHTSGVLPEVLPVASRQMTQCVSPSTCSTHCLRAPFPSWSCACETWPTWSSPHCICRCCCYSADMSCMCGHHAHSPRMVRMVCIPPQTAWCKLQCLHKLWGLPWETNRHNLVWVRLPRDADGNERSMSMYRTVQVDMRRSQSIVAVSKACKNTERVVYALDLR